MKEYKEKVLEFLLQPENFEVVWELYDLIPDKKILFHRFVSYILVKIESILTKELNGTDWIIESDLPVLEYNPAIVLKKDSWNEFFYIEFGFEVMGRFYYGLAREIDSYDFLKDNKKIEKIADELWGDEEKSTREDWFLIIEYLTDYSDIELLKTLHPRGKYGLIEEYAKKILGFAKEIEDKVPKLVEAARAISSKKK